MVVYESEKAFYELKWKTKFSYKSITKSNKCESRKAILITIETHWAFVCLPLLFCDASARFKATQLAKSELETSLSNKQPKIISMSCEPFIRKHLNTFMNGSWDMLTQTHLQQTWHEFDKANFKLSLPFETFVLLRLEAEPPQGARGSIFISIYFLQPTDDDKSYNSMPKKANCKRK